MLGSFCRHVQSGPICWVLVVRGTFRHMFTTKHDRVTIQCHFLFLMPSCNPQHRGCCTTYSTLISEKQNVLCQVSQKGSGTRRCRKLPSGKLSAACCAVPGVSAMFALGFGLAAADAQVSHRSASTTPFDLRKEKRPGSVHTWKFTIRSNCIHKPGSAPN